MTYELSDKEREGVDATSDEKRYGYFVNKAAQGEVWVLDKDGQWPSLVTEADGMRYLPVWPHPGFAEDAQSAKWPEYAPKAVEVHKFLDVLENLDAQGDGLALFVSAEGDFVSVPAGPVLEDLMSALDEIE